MDCGSLGGDRRCLGIVLQPWCKQISVFKSCFVAAEGVWWTRPCTVLLQTWVLEEHLGKKLVSVEKLSGACAFRIAKGIDYSALSFWVQQHHVLSSLELFHADSAVSCCSWILQHWQLNLGTVLLPTPPSSPLSLWFQFVPCTNL